MKVSSVLKHERTFPKKQNQNNKHLYSLLDKAGALFFKQTCSHFFDLSDLNGIYICTVDHTTGRTIGSSQGTPEDRQVPGCLALKSAPRYLNMMNDLIIVLDDLIKGSRQSDDVCLQLT